MTCVTTPSWRRRRAIPRRSSATGGLRGRRINTSKNLGLYNQKQETPSTPEQKQTLLSTWAAFFDYFASAEVIRQRYWDFIKVPAVEEGPKKHAWGFLLTHGALTTILAHGLTYAESLTNGRKAD